ncbi:hypothetical protein [Nonomuraea sp. NPDC005650]|uniref:hypothetical protein n=1 Tax=Nonomuraea sp. NPDC005650 TaxID=3157045 RepID=UPI0033AAEC3A
MKLDDARTARRTHERNPGSRIRWEIRDDIHEAFMTLAAAIICWRRLTRTPVC